MDTALNESIYPITIDAVNETDDCVSSTEPDELGPTRELKIGDKTEVWWPSDYHYYSVFLSVYAEGTEKHRLAHDDGQAENLKMIKKIGLYCRQIKLASKHNEALQNTWKDLYTQYLCCTKQEIYPHVLCGTHTIMNNKNF